MKRKILIAEDNAMNRMVLHNILEKEYDVYETTNGEEAFRFLYDKHKMISALLLDIVMPVMDGFEVLRKMRGNAVLSQIPVIVTTGSNEADTEVKALSLGASDYITKPYNPTLLLHCLRNTINLRETASIVNAIQRDKLTGLYNREAFFDKAAIMLKESRPGAYVMSCLDIDSFKLINDQYGAEEGDRVLKHIGSVANEEITAVGGICSRISVDNFAAIYPVGETEFDRVNSMREKLLTPEGIHIALTFSVGRYIITDYSLSMSAIYDRAYIAKRSVKGRYDKHVAYFDESMREKLLREQAIVSEMDTALAGHQFEAWYQPQYNHATGALIGAEALVRWRHPDLGMISPGAFIPVFEQNGFIYELDKYIWEQVCVTLRKWLDAGYPPLPVSVNISRYDVLRADFIQVLMNLVQEYGIPPERLRLEITESAFSQSTAQIIAVVKHLVEQGFIVEIDDFGSGYSSLNTLKDVPADVLKLDMRFLESSENSQRGGNILESIVRMAKWLNMSVIAEGVETRGQADYLKTIGCSCIQGYLYSKPVMLTDIEALMQSAKTEPRAASLETVEHLDNNAFWDPQSMDTLIFNSYIGSAAIFEYRDERLELLRVNDKFIRLLGGDDSRTAEEIIRLELTSYLEPESAASLIAAVKHSMAAGDEVTGEYAFRDIPQALSFTCLRLTIRVIASIDDRFLVYCTAENITAQIRAERELRETDERLRLLMTHDEMSPELSRAQPAVLPAALNALIEHSADLCFVKDLEYRYVSCSRSFALAVGRMDESEVVGRTDYELVGKVLGDQYRMTDEQILKKNREQVHYEIRLPDENGMIRCINISKYPLLDDKGSIIGIYCLSRDLTESRASDTQLKLLGDALPGGIISYQCSKDTVRMTYFNDGLPRLLGYTREEFMRLCTADPFSLIFKEDKPGILALWQAVLHGDKLEAVSCRVYTRKGDYRWLNVQAAVAGRAGNWVSVHTVMLDMTAQRDAMERLRVNEEEHRLAVIQSGSAIYRYSIADRRLNIDLCAKGDTLPDVLENVPEEPIARSMVSQDTAEAYSTLFEDIARGEKNGSALFQWRNAEGWRWLEARYTTIFSDAGKPVSAILSFTNVTEHREMEAVYQKWQQSLQARDPASYTLFRSNLSCETAYDSVEGTLLHISFHPDSMTFNDCTTAYAEQWIDEEDVARYASLMNSDTLLAAYVRGRRSAKLEYRERLPEGGVRWLQISVDMVKLPNSPDVEAYLMFESIDDSKRAALLALERAERDPLTGVFNRVTFASRVDQIISSAKPGTGHALLMLDVDGFKQVNDAFGHGAGDQALQDIADAMRSLLRRGDLLGRLGGDEFVMFVSDISDDAIALNRAKQICALVRRAYNVEIQISGSVGVAVSPRDGIDFNALYRKADAALYQVKGNGKDSCMLYREGMEAGQRAEKIATVSYFAKKEKKRRMLIVDDNSLDNAFLHHIFKDDFIIEKASDGTSALIRLRHYGPSISVVLLDLFMPGMDGFAVMDKMRASQEMSRIPIIVVSGAEDQETSLRAIRAGATDFITKPVDPDLMRIRVQSAISKAENERLRAQNSFLEMASGELNKYRFVLERMGIVMIEYDWVKGTFVYDAALSKSVAGVWDDRSLWHILLSDFVTDVTTVRRLQEYVYDFAKDHGRMIASMPLLLKNAEGERHWFRMRVYKRVNEFQLTDRMLLTLSDTGVMGEPGSTPPALLTE